jgi:hypothetical protein
MLSQRYKPTNFNGIIGNKKNIDVMVQWINEWTPQNKKKCLLIWAFFIFYVQFLVRKLTPPCVQNFSPFFTSCFA